MQIRLKQAGAAIHCAALAMMCIAATAAEAREASRGTTGAGPIDLAALDHLVGKAQFVVFGEDSHRMPAVHQLVATVFRHLVEEKGFRTFVFEAQWGLEDAIDAFLASDRASLSDEETFLLNAFASEPIVELLLWARTYNAAHPQDPVRFTGYQPEQPVTDAVALRTFAQRVPALDHSVLESVLGACNLAAGRYPNDRALFAALSSRRQKQEPAYAPQARASCLAGLDSLDRELETRGKVLERQSSPAAVKEARLHVLSIRTFVGTLCPAGDDLMRLYLGGATAGLDKSLSDVYLRGDQARFRIFEGLRQTRDRRGKTFLWMHNGHAARTGIEVVHSGHRARFVPLGARLAQRYGRQLVAIATIVPCENCDEPAGSLEPAFAQHFGKRIAIVDFSDAAGKAGLPVRVPGILFAQYHQKPLTAWLDKVVLDTHFDGVIYLPDGAVLP